jgi:threonine dehydrogenase-like Zn-dependent dehydrogenase
MTPADPDEHSRRLAAEDSFAWFERLYSQVQEGAAVAPWDRGGPHPLLVEWAEARGLDGTGRRALVVGAGLGADAEYVAGRGFDTMAFDLAETALRIARERFPQSRVSYRVADLLAPPEEWRRAFDLVFESLTVQSMPPALHADAIEAVAGMVAPGGTLLVVSGAGDEDDDPDGPPWPLTRAEIDAFATGGVEPVRIEELRDPSAPRRWRAEYRRPA